MNAKEYLNRARLLDQRINTKLERVSRLRALTQKITASMDGDNVSHTRNVHSLQDTIDRIIDEEREVNAAIDQLVDLKREVSDVVKQVEDPDCQLLLEMRYLCFNSWEDIIEAMNVHRRTVFKIHDRALRLVDNILRQKKSEENLEIGH